MDAFKVISGEWWQRNVINNYTCGSEGERNCLAEEVFGVIAKVGDFLVNNRLLFIQSARATACRHSWGVASRGTVGLEPNGTTGRVCTQRTANSCAFVLKLWELLKPYNDAFDQTTLCLCTAGTHWKWDTAVLLRLTQKKCKRQHKTASELHT